MSVLPNQVALVSDSQSVSFSDVSTVAAALQKQAARDFGPAWGITATVDAFDSLESVPVDYWPVILRDDINEPGAAGYHTDDNGQPFSLVQIDSSGPLTASHEPLEMLADPFGNRTLAGSPPAGAPKPVSTFKRVIYLVEVCDPCESDTCAYQVNGVNVSDFLTKHYYDPHGAHGVQYSFRGNIKSPHSVLEGGYVSFGNPVTNNWYQIIVVNGQMQVRDLGQLQRNGRSIRETIDARVREIRSQERYRMKPMAAAAKASTGSGAPLRESSEARAKSLRQFIQKSLK